MRSGASGSLAVRDWTRRAAYACVRWSGLPFIIRETVQRRRVTILYHHDIDPTTLEVQLRVLRKRYNFVGLRACVEAIRSGRMHALPPKALVVTLDDGCKENLALLDVFRDLGVTPTIFLCSGIAGTSRRFWWSALSDDVDAIERLKTLPDADRMTALAALGFAEAEESPERAALSRSEIEQMSDAVDFQAHTIYHPMLTRCDDERSWAEISQSMETLTRDFGLDIFALAYPNGDYSDREVAFAAKAGYLGAVTTEVGLNGPRTDPYRLKRIHLPMTASTNETIVRACVLPTYLRHLRLG